MKNKIKLKKGDEVFKEQVIAYVGSTGRSSGAHLHFEFQSLKNRALNPRLFLPIVEGHT